MTERAEQRLIERAANGCRQLFAALVERYRDRLLRFLALRCASREDAEDAVQEVFVAAWRYLPSYDSRWRFSTWLFRIGLRNLPRPGPVTVPLDEDDRAVGDSLDAVGADNVWRLASQHLMADAAAALWLRYGENLSMREIATAASRSVAWVRLSLMRGGRRWRRRMSKALEKRLADDAKAMESLTPSDGARQELEGRLSGTRQLPGAPVAERPGWVPLAVAAAALVAGVTLVLS